MSMPGAHVLLKPCPKSTCWVQASKDYSVQWKKNDIDIDIDIDIDLILINMIPVSIQMPMPLKAVAVAGEITLSTV